MLFVDFFKEFFQDSCPLFIKKNSLSLIAFLIYMCMNS